MMPPVRPATTRPVAIAGLDHDGLHHLERFSLSRNFDPVAIVEPDARRASIAADFGCRVHAGWDEFLADDSFALVLVSGPPSSRLQQVFRVLESGRDVAVRGPLAHTLTDADRVIDAAGRHDRRLLVLEPRRGDDDFLAARTAVAGGGLGELTALKQIAWDYGQPGRSNPHERLVQLLAPSLDQLLLLADRPPHDVVARQLADAGLVLLVGFAGGATGHIEVHTGSPAPLRTGWVLAGTRGGYHDRQQFHVTDDHEVYSTRLPAPADDWDRAYRELFEGLEDADTARTAQAEARRVVAVLDAARRSIGGEGVVEVDNEVLD